jgi:hypothetical protein
MLYLLVVAVVEQVLITHLVEAAALADLEQDLHIQ